MDGIALLLFIIDSTDTHLSTFLEEKKGIETQI
jgi:hypothetical protein